MIILLKIRRTILVSTKKIRAIKITEAAIAETVIAAIATANQITSLMRLLKVKVYWTLCRTTTVS